MNKEWIELIGKYELEGARANFESICTKLFKKIYNKSNVRRVAVKQGDGGIDIFIGEIGVEPISVLQCKFFPDGIEKSQKDQIRKSFRTVMSSPKFEVKDWTLCVINTLNLDENIWWSGWKSRRLSEYGVQDGFIKLNDGDDLIQLLNENDLYNIAFEKKDSIQITAIHDSLAPSIAIDELKNIFKNTSFYISKFKNYFGNKPNTHIDRPETQNIITWINSPLQPGKRNILVIEGEKGNGKTVIIKDVYDRLLGREDLVLCIKSDKYYDESPVGLEEKLFLNNKVTFSKIIELIQKHDRKLTVIIDQLDALSQTLSSDRQYIQSYNRIIAELEGIEGIRVIISTRSFDLQYDANLSIYNCGDYTKIKVDRLSDNEVIKVLNDFSVANQPKKLIELLKTPNHLEIFCKLPNKNKVNVDGLLSLKDLFDELWKEVISSKSDLRSRELLYKIADDMYESGQKITIQNKYNDTYYQELQYLKSNQIIIEDNSQIQFFHQTLYEYCFSRQFIDNDNELQSYILDNKQSLYIRSVIKMIIEYLRDADSRKYISSLDVILVSSLYRFHIKTLLLATLGVVQNPTEKEKNFIKENVLKSNELKDVFLLAIQSDGWSMFIVEQRFFDANFAENLETVWQFFRKNISYYPKRFIEYLEALDNYENMKYFIERVLSLNDNWHSEELLVFFETYITYSYDDDKRNLWYYDILKKIADYHFDFAIDKLKNILNEPVEGAIDHHLANFIEKLNLLNPSATFQVLHETYNQTTEQSKYSKGYDRIGCPYYFNRRFYPQSLSKRSKESIEDYLSDHVKKLATNHSEYRKFYAEYVNSDSILMLMLVIEGLQVEPAVYENEIFELIKIVHSKSALKADDDNFQFSIRKLLGSAFPYFSDERKRIVVEILNDVTSENEGIYIAFKDEPKYRRISNTVGRKKYLFLKSVPFLELGKFPQLRRNFLELSRRYPQIKVDNAPDNGYGIAGIVGPPLPNTAYQKMSLDDWQNSMIKFNEEYREEHIYLKGGMSQHAQAFGEAVKQNPDDYYEFLQQLFEVNGVSKQYVLYGLDGMIAVGYNIIRCKSIFQKLLSCKSNISLLHRLISMARHFIDNNELDEEIFAFLCGIAIGGLSEKEVAVMNLTDDGLVYVRGEAIGQIINCCEYNEYGGRILSIVENSVSEGLIAINITVIRHLAYMNHIDIERTFEIFKRIVDTDNTELLKNSFWSASFLNNTYHFEMYPYFEKIIAYPEFHNMGNTIILSWLNDEINDRSLYETFVKASVDAKLCALHIAEHNLFDSSGEINEKSLSILYEFLSEEERTTKEGESFALAYSCIILRQFKEDKHFLLFLDFFESYSHSLHCKNAPGYFLQYLIKCSGKYPLQCLNLLKNIDFANAPDIQHSGYYREEPIQLLLAIYSVLSQKAYRLNPDEIEETLNIFDGLLKHNHLRDAASNAIEMVLN